MNEQKGEWYLKKNRLASVLLICFLILMDQTVKFMISRWLYHVSFSILGDMLHFSPVYNTDLSWVNSWLNLGMGFIPHLMLNVLILLLVVLIYKYSKSRYAVGKGADAIFILFMAGALCSLIDKIFWPGSLDYIYLKGFFTFDLKDIYLSACEVLLVIIYIKNIKRWKDIRLRQEVKDFAQYVYRYVCRVKSKKNTKAGHEI